MKKLMTVVVAALGLLGTVDCRAAQSAARNDGAGCAAGEFPFRIALTHSVWGANEKNPGNFHDQYDLHFKNAGWPALDKYPCSHDGLDKLTASLKNYDVVVFSTLFNWDKGKPPTSDVTRYAKAWRKYLEDGGSFFIMDAMYGQQSWLKAIDPGLDFSAVGGCGAMYAPTQPVHPTLAFPNTIAGAASWGHLIIPPKSKWQVVCGCCGGKAATIAVAQVGKGFIYLSSTQHGGRWHNLTTLENFLAFLRTDGKIAMDTSAAPLIPDFMPGKAVAYELSPVSNRTDKAVTVELVYTVTAAGESRVFSWKDTLAPFAAAQPTVTSDLPMRGKATARVDVLVDGKAIAPRTRDFDLPKFFRVKGPRYRNYLPANERERVTVGAEIVPYDEDLSKMTCRLRVPGLLGTNDAGFVETVVSNRSFRLPFKVKDRQELHFKGPVVLKGELLSEGRVIATDEVELFVMPGRPNVFSVRDDLTFLSDGKPFFPLGIYHTHPDNYAQHAADGFNMVQDFSWRGAEKILSAAQTNNLKVLIEHHAQHNHAGYRGYMMSAYINHPALGWWYVYDEPGLDMTECDLRYRALKEDITHPAYLVSCNSSQFTLHQRACDIFAVDVYPIRAGKATCPLDVVATVTDRAMEATGGDKPVVFILQSFGKEPENMMVNMAYQAIIHGASGLYWYPWDEGEHTKSGAKYHPETQRILKRITGEMKKLKPLLLNRTSHKMWVQDGVHILQGKTERKTNVMILCNPTDAPLTTTVELEGFRPGSSVVHDYFGGPQPPRDGTRVTPTLEPYGVRVYRW